METAASQGTTRGASGPRNQAPAPRMATKAAPTAYVSGRFRRMKRRQRPSPPQDAFRPSHHSPGPSDPYFLPPPRGVGPTYMPPISRPFWHPQGQQPVADRIPTPPTIQHISDSDPLWKNAITLAKPIEQHQTDSMNGSLDTILIFVSSLLAYPISMIILALGWSLLGCERCSGCNIHSFPISEGYG